MSLFEIILKRSRLAALGALVLGLIGGFASAGLVAVIRAALESDARPASLAVTFVGLCAVMIVARFWAHAVVVRQAEAAVYDLRLRLSRQILDAPLRTVEEMGPARLLAILTEDVLAVAGAIPATLGVVPQLAVVLGCLVYMAWLSFPLFLASVLTMAAGIFVYRAVAERAVKQLDSARKDTDDLARHFRTVTDGVKELKLHRKRREEFFAQVLGPTAASAGQNAMRGMTAFAAANGIGQALLFFAIGGFLFLAPTLWKVAGPTVGGFVLAALYLIPPLDFVLGAMPVLTRGTIALRSIEAAGLSLSSAREDHGTDRPAPAIDTLALSAVTYSYHREDEGRSFTVGPVDLALRPGEIVFIVGGNGGGKTTLAKVLAGLYTPESGEVRLNGELVGRGEEERHRELFSAVFSDAFVFDSLLGIDGAGVDEAARALLSRLQLDHKVRIDGRALSTTALSLGQRKRLALLMALLDDRPIYLFDEWAAEQDPTFRELFYTHFLPELRARGKAVLVISHDDRYFRVADRILKFEYGKVLAYDSRTQASETSA
ncbi:cyclic peptide export ABC transporter [Polyangium sp. 6x1]|uniref:cyclic peptide export ABC transporter n=1 Tax=Polyangium sp. 6x1 TaxID=3042689 RepID=UPI00248266D3|nr:cyclic peptide export ABC transporter [Polyangium sp. 6x1]MDI1443019.1 cyclic peptide export ABC transporter [Polyangium sp. 6x1]